MIKITLLLQVSTSAMQAMCKEETTSAARKITQDICLMVVHYSGQLHAYNIHILEQDTLFTM